MIDVVVDVVVYEASGQIENRDFLLNDWFDFIDSRGMSQKKLTRQTVS